MAKKTTELERAERREKQQKWRAETASECITVHLNAIDAATLDAIAIELYWRHPHDPPQGVIADVEVYPGRPAAVRELCRRWREEHGKPMWLARARLLLAGFYRAEASWRRAGPDTEGKRPVLPLRAETRRNLAAMLGLQVDDSHG